MLTETRTSPTLLKYWLWTYYNHWVCSPKMCRRAHSLVMEGILTSVYPQTCVCGEDTDLRARQTNALVRELEVVARLGVLLSPEARVISPLLAIHPVDTHISDGQQNASVCVRIVREETKQEFPMNNTYDQPSFSSISCLKLMKQKSLAPPFPPHPFPPHVLVWSFFFLTACRMLSLIAIWVNSWTCVTHGVCNTVCAETRLSITHTKTRG